MITRDLTNEKKLSEFIFNNPDLFDIKDMEYIKLNIKYGLIKVNGNIVREDIDINENDEVQRIGFILKVGKRGWRAVRFTN